MQNIIDKWSTNISMWRFPKKKKKNSMCPSPISSNQIKPCDREKIILKRRKEKCLTPLDKCQKKKRKKS